MIAKNTTTDQLHEALRLTNEKYKGNICFRHVTPEGRRIRFTLTVNSSKAPGGRRGHTGRRIASACWHVHGDFFDNLLSINEDAEIVSRSAGGPHVINIAGGNWADVNIGSQIHPMYYSEACDCNS